MSRKESLPSVGSWRLALGVDECTHHNAHQKGFSEETEHPLQVGHRNLASSFRSFLPPKEVEVENHLGKKIMRLIYNRVVILGLGEPKQIMW